MADLNTPPGMPGMGAIQSELASEFGGAIPTPNTSAFSIPESGYEAVGNTIYQKAGSNPDGSAIWQGPDGQTYNQAELDQQKADYEKYGGILGQSAAAGLGLARGATFGGSDVAAKLLGLDEAVKKIKEANPTTSTAADITGAVLPSLFLGPEGEAPALARAFPSLAKAAEFTGPALARSAGHMAEDLIASGVESAGAKTLAQKIIQNIAAPALGSAAEGAFYGAGQVVSDAALGDPEALGEKALTTIGLSGAFGGLLGGAFPALKAVAPSLIDRLEASSSKLSEGLSSFAESASQKASKVISAVSHLPEEELAAVLSPSEEGKMLRVGAIEKPLAQNVTKKTLQSDFNEYVTHANDTVDSFVQDLHPEQMKQAFDESVVDHSKVVSGAQDLYKTTDDVISRMKASPEIYTDGTRIAEVEQAFDKLKQKFGNPEVASSPFEIHTAANDFKKELKDIIKFDKKESVSRGTQLTVQTLKSLYGEAVGFTTNPEIFDKLALETGEFNSLFKDYSNARQALTKDFLDKSLVNGREVFNWSARKSARFFNDLDAAKNVDKLEVIKNYMNAVDGFTSKIKEIANGPYNVADLVNSNPELLSTLNKVKTSGENAAEGMTKLKGASIVKKMGSSGIVKEGDIAIAGGLAHLFGPLGVGIGFAAKKLLHPVNLITGLAQLERLTGKLSNHIDTSVGEFLTKSAGAISKSSVPLTSKILSESNFSFGGRPVYAAGAGSAKPSAYHQRLDELAQLRANPEQAALHIAKSMEPLNTVAPHIGQATQMKALNAATHLYETAPKDPLAGQRLLPTKHDYQPSDRDLNKWARRIQVAENPLSILGDLRAGTLTREQVETLKIVAPKMYQEITQTIIQKITENPKELSYPKRAQLSVLFGQPLDPAFQSSFVQTMQSNHVQNQSRTGMPGAVNATATGMSKLNLTENRETTMEKLQGG